MRGEPIKAQPRPVREPKPKKRLARKHWMRKKAPRRIARETPAEKYYKHWIHTRPCRGHIIAGHVCAEGEPVQQMHLRDMTGASLKESNFDSIAGCPALHESYDQAKGSFYGWSKEARKAWMRTQILHAHFDFVEQHGCLPEDWRRPLNGEGRSE